MKKQTLSTSAPDAIIAPRMILRSSENSIVDFSEIAEQLEAGTMMTPKEVSDARGLVAAYLSRMRWVMGTLAARRARTVTQWRDSYRSNAETERAWEATEAGQQEVQLKHQINALEQLATALDKQWWLLQGEARGNY